MVVLIPAYRPSDALIGLVEQLRAARPGLPVLVVDDGSGGEYADVFARARGAGADVVAHLTNAGKGAALRTGIALIRRRHPGADVVCADADGQHAVEDVLGVADDVASSGRMVLGVRSFDGEVPLRSRLGNTMTRWLFRAATGRSLLDTQTGLRGYPAPLLGWLLTIPGDRYEYELSALLRATRDGLPWQTWPIRTIYADGNAASHFRPVADSIRIYLPLLTFAASSLAAFAVDTVALLALHAATGSLGFSVVAARLLSGVANFAVNRRVVFRRGRSTPLGRAAARYALLAVVLLAASYLLLSGLTSLGVPLLPATILTDSTLFGVSFLLQRHVVFDGGSGALRPAPELSPDSQETSRTVAAP